MEIDWQEGPIGVRLPLKYWEIAQLVGITPEHLSRILRQLEQEGIIKRKDGRLVISDFRKLYHPTDL
jgi:DNA-binding Lrp family transcriptional regulator